MWWNTNRIADENKLFWEMLGDSLLGFICIHRAVNGCDRAQKSGCKHCAKHELIERRKEIDYCKSEQYLPTLGNLTSYYTTDKYYNSANLSEDFFHRCIPFLDYVRFRVRLKRAFICITYRWNNNGIFSL